MAQTALNGVSGEKTAFTCKFPGLLAEDELQINERAQSVVAQPSTESWKQFWHEKKISHRAVIQAVWALVLNVFTGDDLVCAKVLSLDNEGGLWGLFTAHVDRKVTFLELLESIENQRRENVLFKDDEFTCNTSVCFIGNARKISDSEEELDISLHVTEEDEQLGISICYNTSYLSQKYAKIVSETFGHLLAEVSRHPSRELSDINLVHPQILNQMKDWTKNAPLSEDRCIGPLFEKMARERPAYTAIQTSEVSLTYQELDGLSSRLALHLQAMGVGPELAVMLCFPKSAWAVVAMVAVIRAGGVMLCLDPSHPKARHQEIQHQVKSRWILTTPGFSDRWSWSDAAVLSIDRAFVESLPLQSEERIISDITPSNALYMIFTSGSTGKPKGCVIEHRQFLTGSLAQQKASHMNSSDKVLQLASFTFDVSILEIITSLISGACVCIPNDDERSKGPAYCIQFFGITWAFLTPSLVKLMSPDLVPTLKFLVLGGEAVQQENIQVWASHVRLANGYGPTECSIAATGNAGLSPNTSPANIGHPLGGCCWVVDKDNHDRLLPIGAPGELIIQGPIVARGYLNEIEKTRAVFLENTKWLPADATGPYRRLYKTGDLARFNADGSIHFIGRKDSQIKLRGLRIELGEIEHRLAAHPLVQQAVVVLAKQGLCQGKLAAVISLKTFHQASDAVELVNENSIHEAMVQLEGISDDLSQQLPDYMQPTIWAPVKSIPLTISGKLNGVLVRQWIENMQSESYNLVTGKAKETEHVTIATNDTERDLQEACANVLGVQAKEVWLNRSFIQNGGDSIQAMQLLEKLRRKGVLIGFADLMRMALNELAAQSVEQILFESSEEAIPTPAAIDTEKLVELNIRSDEIEEVYPLSSVQQGIMLSQQQNPGSYHFRITCEVLVPQGQPVETNRLRSAWQQMVRRHPALRTIFIETEKEDGLLDQLVLRAHNARIVELRGADEGALFKTLDSHRRIDDKSRPAVEFIISSTDDGRVFCTVDINHALIDGVSVLVLFRDLSQAYSGILDRESTIRYSPYMKYFQKLSVDDALSHWTQYLEGCAPCHFPVLNDNKFDNHELHELKGAIDDVDAIHSFCKDNNLTPATVFQAAWALVLAAYTGRDDLQRHKMASCRDFRISTVRLLPFSMLSGFLSPCLTPLCHSQVQSGAEIWGTESKESVGFRVVSERDPTEYNVSVNIFVSKSTISVALRHYTDQLSDGMTKNVFETFCTAIRRIISSPHIPLGGLNILSDRDQEQIAKWNSYIWPEVNECVHDVIRRQAVLRRDEQAVDAWDGSFTYQELDSTTDYLANILAKNGVGAEVLVPICFRKSRWTVVAQVAVLKAGGVCVAFDPEHPKSRREEMIKQCDAKLAVVAEGVEPLFKELLDTIIVVGPDLLNHDLPGPSTILVPKPALPSNAAFVVFTSGSTGRPKGILLEHRAFCSSSSANSPAMNYGPGARVLQFASYTFDVSIGETFMCLMSGGTLCIPHEEERLNDVAGAINRAKANVVYLTPSVGSFLQPSDIPGIRTLVLGGESLREENISTWAEKTHLLATYGPAECSVYSTSLVGVPKGTSPQNIGYGFGSRMWVAHPDDAAKLSSVGAIGELLIEGPILARGYLNDQAKTDAAFIPAPAWLPLGESETDRPIRVYKTGDLVRYNSDGTLCIVGRRDNQVKLHGQRIEMGEVEHAILAYESIYNALAIVPKTGALKNKLVAVLSLREATSSSVPSTNDIQLLEDIGGQDVQERLHDVRQHTSSVLPPYMVPSVWFAVKRIPVTSHGKSDRSMVTSWLTTLDQDFVSSNVDANIEVILPGNETESAIRAVVASVLNIPEGKISMNQSFLALGGDSITAMQVASRCRARKIHVAVKDILRSVSFQQVAMQAKTASGSAIPLDGSSGPFELMRDFKPAVLDNLAERLGIDPQAIEDIYPCSPMQEGILISQSQAPETYKFFAVFAIRSKDATIPVSADYVRRAWRRLVARHPSMRTILIENPSQDRLYAQIVLKNHNPRMDTAHNLDSLFRYPYDHPLDYSELTPPHRLTIFEGKDVVYANLEINHAITDGGSMAIMVRDLASGYSQELSPGPAYKDYISVLQNLSKERILSFWKNHLKDAQPTLFPQLQDERAPNRELRVVNIPIAKDTRLKLQKFTKTNKVTLANIFQAVWALVLRVYSGESDVVFGYLSSGRDTEGVDVESSVGVFITMLVCRVLLEDSSSLLTVLQKIQDGYLDSLPHQHTSLAEIQHALQLSGERLFNTILTLQRPMVEDNADHAVSLEYLGGSDPTEYDLGVDITITETTIDVSINYWTTFMSEQQAALLGSTFSSILSSLLAFPQSNVGDVDLLGEDQYRQIRSWNNGGAVPDSSESCIHDLVHEQAIKQPGSVAIHAWDGSFSFAELDTLAARLATQLAVLGVGPETPVPLCFDKSAWTIVAMLAVLKAGGAYTAMNPAHPIQHLESIIRQTNSRIILVGSESYGIKFERSVDHIIVVQSSLFHTLPDFEPTVIRNASPENAAMINFTSGSTGKPKGIVITHRGFCSMTAHNEGMCIRPTSRVLQFCSYTFDTSNSEIFFTLTTGGSVYVPSEHDRLNNLPGIINRFGVNHAFLTPSVAISLSPQDVPTLKTLVLVGEAVSEDVAKLWQDDVVLVNSYGPAECTVCSSYAILRQGVVATNIGLARGCNYWVTEPGNSQRLKPVGCVGELLIEGPIVARGYLDADLTARAFIPPPGWRGECLPETRLYKTGDLVRYASDGTLIYIGRKDGQIKLNGQRIEMGEVEKEIKSYELVQQAVVLLPKSGPCKKKLTAVVALKGFAPPISTNSELEPLDDSKKTMAISQVEKIRERLTAVIPSYAVPSVWLMSGTMPLTASAKTNTPKVIKWVENLDSNTYDKALAETETDEPVEVSPGSLEGQLQRIIARVLNTSPAQVPLSRSFLNLGGDSITAMQLVVRCRGEGLRIVFKDVMQTTSIAALASHVEATDDQPRSKAEIFDSPFDLTPIQQLYFQDVSQSNLDPDANQFNQSMLFRLARDVSYEELKLALDSLVKRHSMLRARFGQSPDGQWTQTIPSKSTDSYRFRAHEVETKEQALELSRHAQEGLDIRTGPVFGAELFFIDGQSQLLFLVAHHLVIDLVSWRIMVQEIEDFIESGPSNLDSPPFPFQTWQQLQAQYAAKSLKPDAALPYSVPQADYSYWGMDYVPNFKKDTAELTTSMSPEDTDLLLTQCHRAMGTETLDILLAALFSSFVKTFGRPPPAIFNEGHGRQPWTENIDLSETVGWFTTIFPFHVPVNLEAGPIAIIRSVKDQRRSLPAHGWSYFTSRYLNEEGQRAFKDHMPLEILFNYLGLYQGMEREDGLFQLLPFNEGDVGPAVRRYSLFEINVYVLRRSAHMSFTFNRKMKHVDLIQTWVRNYNDELKTMCQILKSAETILTRSDYPLLPISYNGLDQLCNQALPQLGISPKNVEDIYPCSPLQEGILLSQTRVKEAYAYHATMELKSTSGAPVSARQLASAWEQIVERHAMLRTIFLEKVTSRPFDQIVLRKSDAKPLLLEAQSYQEAINILNRLEKLTVSPAEPPHRLTVVETTDSAVFFKLEISHALVDGTTMSILITELLEAYTGKLMPGTGPLYSDYIAYIQSQPIDEARHFWIDYLKDVKPCQFPSLRESENRKSELCHVSVPVPSLTQVRQFCQQNDVTLASIIRLAWGLVLSAYTGEEQVCFGYLTAGREIPVAGVENGIGPFINMLVCSLNVSNIGLQPVISELKELQQDYIHALPHQHIGLAEICHALGLGGTSLFNTVISFQHRDIDNLALEDLRIEYISGEDPTEVRVFGRFLWQHIQRSLANSFFKYDITVNAIDSDKGWEISLGYLEARLSSEQAANLAATLSTTLTSLISSPQSKVGSIDIFSNRDSAQVWKWNSDLPSMVNECLHTLFQRQAMMNPDSPAITSWDQDLTYRQLDDRTTQLAHLLLDLGIGSGDLIPVCFEKSAWAIVGMLGILKTGAGFVPLDPSHPPQRLASIVNQLSPPLVLTSPNTSKLVVQLVKHILVVSRSASTWVNESTEAVNVSVSPQHVAYTLFTSGSTGTPKGVVVEHSAAATSIMHHGLRIGCSSETRMFQFAAYTFDACILEIFTTLAYGGCICVPSEAERMNDISGSINRLRVNTTFLTPSVIRILRPEAVPTLKTVILGGEALGKDNIQIWAERLRLMNGYGPTETCVFAVMKTFTTKDEQHNVLGHAVSCLTWITQPNDHNKLAPIGSVGELLIQGETLAQGYLHDETKSAAVFIKNPEFYPRLHESDCRFYKTGDLVRYSSDGSITYLGRKDTQIKLRGQRIELSEIEHQVKQCLPGNFQSAVEVVEPHNEKDQAALAVFICESTRFSRENLLTTMTDEFRSLAAETQKALTQTLPIYMQPSFYFPINQMPTTSAQKLDRTMLRDCIAALSDADLKQYSLVKHFHRLPTTSTEKSLQELWHQILNIPTSQIGVDDNFFQIGGDSIAAMKIAAASPSHLNISVADIFRYPVLTELASVISSKAKPNAFEETQIRPFELLSKTIDPLSALNEITAQHNIAAELIEDLYPCTPLQQGMMTLSILNPGTYVLRQVFRLAPSVNIAQFQSAWDIVSSQHPILRTRFVQTVCAGLLQVVVKGHTAWKTAKTLQQYLDLDTMQQIGYGASPVRYGITDDGHFIWTGHHAIYDGWSLPLIFKQMQFAYEHGYCPRTLNYNTFIKSLQETESESSHTFWKRQLAGERPSTFPELPSTQYRPRIGGSSKYKLNLPNKTLGTNVLRAAWTLVLSRYTDSEDIVFGTTLSGRNVPVHGIDKMIGPTITTVPVRVHLKSGLTVAALLDQLNQQNMEMIPHEHFGLHNIANLSPECAQAIEFQNLFVIQPVLESTQVSQNPILEQVDLAIKDFDTYPLIFECQLAVDGILIEARYDESLLSASKISWMLHHYEYVLNQLMDQTAQESMVADISIFSDFDNGQILQWNQQYPEVVEATVPQIFAEQVVQHPTALAVDAWDGQLTYFELDRLSTLLAKHLVYLGVGPEILVPLCFEKSRWAIVAQMAVMKAGGACVNLDPAHPLTRLETIVKATRANVLLGFSKPRRNSWIFGRFATSYSDRGIHL
ncbi:hypothetical protein UREG_04461 [Uncinocarpus reesii 1704]|uniref:Carrier domain-containing protein n=1 Tax=Uncinocarpus reesii (strain UAMH 1704) TaxID=336963 RepID=C4JP79_UNCRE|nr:uncharacterized protein UREG_04461 [Uncinocarpus reesii 1704]EEP79615.1 hypothetical protein UREG_04461 [Uncinocarpus reesii 1704]